MRSARVIDFPQQQPPPAYSEGYRDGLKDGEKWANANFVWLGVGIGVVLCAFIALVVVAWLAR